MSKGVPCSSFTDGRTHTHTQTHRVTTEDTLSGFQEFFLQPIIKELSNNKTKQKTHVELLVAVYVIASKSYEKTTA